MTNAPHALLLRLGKVILSVSLSWLFYCSTDPIAAGGSGTGVGNGMITGKVNYSNNAPVSNAMVRLRTITFLADTSGVVSTLHNDTIATAYTAADGSFSFDTVDTARTYFIEVVDSAINKQGTLFRVTVPTADTVLLPARVVSPVKVLTGKIIVSGIPKNAYVLIYGLERVDKTDSQGRFEITDLPIGNCEEDECEYKLRILIPTGTGAIQSIDTELEIEFDVQGNIKEVEIEIEEDDDD
jgi:hypothetical protein